MLTIQKKQAKYFAFRREKALVESGLYVSGSVNELSHLGDVHKSVGELQKEKATLPCRFSGCLRVFRYSKCRVNHEKSEHSLELEDSDCIVEDIAQPVKPEDHIFNYGCLHISLGLLIRDAEDSVKEGDGERLVRVWKFLTLLFRLNGCHKYALAGLRLID